MNNPWNRPELQPVKLLSIDELEMTAEVYIKNIGKKIVPINMPIHQLETILEIGNFYGDTAFLNHDKVMVNHSALSIWNGTLTKAGADVYE